MHGWERWQDMTRPSCNAPIALPALIEYWLGEVTDDQEKRIEEHILGCNHCAGRLEELVSLASGIRSAFRHGAIRAVISAPFLEKMKQDGLRLREYRVSPGESVRCTISAADDAVIGRLEAPLAGVSRLDLVRLDERGEARFRLQDIPFDASSGEVLLCPSAASLKKMTAYTERVRLLAVDEAGERLIADYTFIHTPS